MNMKKLFVVVLAIVISSTANAQSREDELQARVDSLEREVAYLKTVNESLAKAIEALTGDSHEAPQPPVAQSIGGVSEEVPEVRQSAEDTKPAIERLKKQTDDDITLYTYSLGPFGKWNRCAIYIVDDHGELSLRLKAAVSTSERLSFTTLTLYCDGATIDVPFDVDDKVQDSYSTRNTDKLRESIDTQIDDQVALFLRSLVNGSERKIIFEGRFKEQRNFSKKEIEGIATVLDAYDTLLQEQGE